MHYSPIRNVYQCRLEAITPLHVGTGENLKSGFDFFSGQRKIHMINSSRLFQEVQRLGPQKLNEFTVAIDDGSAETWLGRQGIRPDKIAVSSLPKPAGRPPREIRAHIKNGFGIPYLPGSSIKGALRTAVIRRLARENHAQIKSGSSKPKFADQKICNALLSNNKNDAKMNLMRTLTVGDFALDKNSVNLFMVWVNRLTSPQKFDGKFPIFIEGLTRNAETNGIISFDCFLPQKDAEESCFNFEATLTLDWLLAACRELTAHTIETEQTFFQKKSGKPVKSIQAFYQTLAEEKKKLAPNEGIIQLAWGAGWRGMTGQLLETKDLTRNVRKQLKLAPQEKYLDYPYPKSRRIVTTNGEDLPLGWVKISFQSKEELRRQKEARKKQQIIVQQEEEKRIAESARLSVENAKENFKSRVAQCRNLPGEIESFVQSVKHQENEKIRVEMCKTLLTKASSLGKKKKFSKALKEERKWAQTLKVLCDTNNVPTT